MKEPNVKITMGFFGKPIINTKRLKINAIFFFGGYVGGYSNRESKKSHMIMLFLSGGLFTVLLAIPVTLYLTDGYIRLGDIIAFFPSSPVREDLFSVPVGQMGFHMMPWLSLATPLDIFNMFVIYARNIIAI